VQSANGVAERGRECGRGNRGQVRGWLPEGAHHGHVYDSARVRGGGYRANAGVQATGADRVVLSGRERRGKRGRDWDGPTRPKGRGGSGHGLI
jgi:hypothetical protein